MRMMKTSEAIGYRLYHDVTQIVPGVVKGRLFPKGHIIREEDVEPLLSIGRDVIYVEDDALTDLIHENEAAQFLAQLVGIPGMVSGPLSEGKIELLAAYDGFFQVNRELLVELNMVEGIIVSTKPSETAHRKGEKLVSVKIVPLQIEAAVLEGLKEMVADRAVFRFLPYKNDTAGMIITGNEVYSGRIQDAFAPVLRKKMEYFRIAELFHTVLDDQAERITKAILECKEKGCRIIFVTGGMSVDPGDVTPTAIRNSGAHIVSYGSPVLPGAMFLLAYFDDGTVVMGLPASVIFCEKTVLDLILPRVLADLEIDKRYIASLACGGLL